MQTRYVILTTFAFSLSAAHAQEIKGGFDRSLNVSGPVELDMQTDSGGIAVVAGAPGVVKIHAILKAQRKWLSSRDVEDRIRRIEQNPPIEQSGNRIRIGHGSDRNLLEGISMRLEIQAPAEAGLLARADSGGIRVEGLKGRVDCKTDSGGVEIARAGSEVRAEADSGGIRIRGVEGSVFARTDSGGIEAVDVSGPVDVAADSGGIRIGQTKAAYVKARASSGGENLRLAPGQGYDLALSSGSSRISAPALDSSSGVSPHRVTGKLRGGGPRVDVNIDSGRLVVE